MALAESITISESNGLTFLQVDNPFATAKISLFGGQILSFIPKKDSLERLWVSPHAYFNGERPIRGGIPICWPWFSDDHGREKGELPSHGFLRTQIWQLVSSHDDGNGTHINLIPSFTRAEGFEYDCLVTLEITIAEQLTVRLKTDNTGIIPFRYNCAMHSYFQIEHIKHTRIEGITGNYKDKTENGAIKSTLHPYEINAETDNIHLSAIESATIVVNESPFTEVNSVGNDSLVVWNPWHGAASITDMDPFGYKHMLCIETALTQGKLIQPGESHTLIQRINPL